MAKAEPDKKQPEARAVFDQAFRFLVADDILRRNAAQRERVAEFIAIPTMVMSAFAAELFLKALLIMEGKAAPNVHHLATLYAKLSPEMQNVINAGWQKSMELHGHELDDKEKLLGVTIPRELTSALADCGDTFKLMRYVYEDPKKVKFYIIDFAVVVYQVILNFKPEWRPPIAASSK